LDQERVLYTYNARDFCRLHSEFLRAGRHHAGIIIGEQQVLSVGEEMRRLLRLSDARSREEMRDRLEYLGNWSTDLAIRDQVPTAPVPTPYTDSGQAPDADDHR
jgi:hypothetical protein